MTKALRLLQLAEEKWPPPGSAHHALTAGVDGKLHLTVFTGATYQDFPLDEADLALDPETLVGELEKMRTW